MTVRADSRKRVVLPCNPGDTFDVRKAGSGTIVLRLMEPAQERPAKVRIEKRGGFSVGVTDAPINEAAIKELLDEFP